MKKLLNSEISIVTVKSTDEKREMGMFQFPGRVVSKFSKIQAKILQENLTEISHVLAKIVDNLHVSPRGSFVDSMTFSLGIDTSGKISLVGELSGALKSGISITIKRNYRD